MHDMHVHANCHFMHDGCMHVAYKQHACSIQAACMHSQYAHACKLCMQRNGACMQFMHANYLHACIKYDNNNDKIAQANIMN